jgi:exosortase/archaeosortase family protein
MRPAIGTKLDSRQKKLFETLVFLLKLLVFAVPLYAIMSFQGILYPLQAAVTHNVLWLMGLAGLDASASGFLITAGEIVFLVSEDCTGWKSMLLLAALVLSVPGASPKRRLAGLAAGIPLIYAGNLFRILAVVFVWRSYGLGPATAVHDYLWQAGLIFLVLAAWTVWLAWAWNIGPWKGKTLIKRRRKLIKPEGGKLKD